MQEADKKVLRSVWLWLKYIMIPPTLIWFAYGELLFEWVYNHYSIFFVMLGATCNAIMDVITHHFETSIFRNTKASFFNPKYSWMNKYKKMGTTGVDMDKRRMLFWFIPMPVQFSDLWHMAKTVMIISLSVAVITYNPFVWWIDLLFVGYFWNITFSLFYDIILRKK